MKIEVTYADNRSLTIANAASSPSQDYPGGEALQRSGLWAEIRENDTGDGPLQRARLQALYERHGKPTIIAEANSMGGPVIEQLARDGLKIRPFVTTNASKAEAIEALALAFERGEIKMLHGKYEAGSIYNHRPGPGAEILRWPLIARLPLLRFRGHPPPSANPSQVAGLTCGDFQHVVDQL